MEMVVMEVCMEGEEVLLEEHHQPYLLELVDSTVEMVVMEDVGIIIMAIMETLVQIQ